MSAKKMPVAELRTGVERAAERMQVLRQAAIELRDVHRKDTEFWFRFNAEVRAYSLSLHVLWCNTGGEFGEDTTDGAR